MKKTLLAAGGLALSALLPSASAVDAQQQRDPRSMGGGDCAGNVYNCMDTPNPLPAPNTVWIEEMTWMDVRDALESGVTTALITTGGVEPNGPFLATGKHNFVLRANCDAIARELGDALCAPVIKLVPEGNIDPPSSHMTSPGTISMTQPTFEAMLTDVAHSLKMHGFRSIIFFGDSGGNQTGMRNVAEALNGMWDDVVVAHVPEYYDYGAVDAYMAARGFPDGEGDGLHDDPIISLNMFADDPYSIRYDERVEAGLVDDQRGLARRSRAERRVGTRRRRLPRRLDGRVHPGRDRDGWHEADAAPGSDRAAPGWLLPGSSVRSPIPATWAAAAVRTTSGTARIRPTRFPAAQTLWIEEMTWMDVRDALQAGKTTAIISTGGVEPNGPWLVTGKHNYVLRENCPRIASYLANALCAPVLELVPEGSLSSHRQGI